MTTTRAAADWQPLSGCWQFPTATELLSLRICKTFSHLHLRYIIFYNHCWQGKNGKRRWVLQEKVSLCGDALSLCLQPPAKTPAVFDLSSHLEGGQNKKQQQQGGLRERSQDPTVWPRSEILVPLSDITRGQSPKLCPVEHRWRWSWQAVQVTRTFTFGNMKFSVWLLIFFQFKSSVVVVNYFSNWATFFSPQDVHVFLWNVGVAARELSETSGCFSHMKIFCRYS